MSIWLAFRLSRNMKNKIHSSSRLSYVVRALSDEKHVEDFHSQTLNFNKQIKAKEDVFLDIYKERLKYGPIQEAEKQDSTFGELNLNHGICGVFDIEDLIKTLQHQQAKDIFVASVPKEMKYVDYIVIVSGRSQKHMQAIAHFVRRVFKHKKYNSDVMPKVEGENSHNWIAMDMGNIALHIFSQKARVLYDLEVLWTVGPKYDDKYRTEEPISNLLERYSYSLNNLEPAS